MNKAEILPAWRASGKHHDPEHAAVLDVRL